LTSIKPDCQPGISPISSALGPSVTTA
jgi:hypothetical protein